MLHAMSYSIPKLSAACAGQSIPIAPELLIADGVPPMRGLHHEIASQSNGIASPNHGGFQSSSARDEDMRWAYSAPPIRTDPPWEGKAHAYRDTKQYHPVELPEGSQCSPVKPRKRARISKSEATLPEVHASAKEYDREDPSGNYIPGPVFVHPPVGATQACVRCHRIKRKCDNARPKCAGCSKARVACVFELSPATSM